jgi:hypothetical protein
VECVLRRAIKAMILKGREFLTVDLVTWSDTVHAAATACESPSDVLHCDT